MSQTDESDYSSSEEDEDYVPSGDDESCDELEDTVVEEGTANSPGQKKKTKTKKEISSSDTGVRRRKGWNALADVAAEEQKQGGETGDGEERLAEAREEEAKKKEEVLKKKRADDLWSSFLSDVGQRPKPKPTPSQQQQNGQSIGKPKASAQSTSSAASNDNDLNGSKPSETVKITKVYDFAGEEVRVTKEVDAASKEAKSFLKKQEEEEEGVPPASSGASTSASSKPATPSGLKRAGGGLGSVLGQIGKKQKISTLEKSRLDWMNFKKAEGIEEDLKIHNKGKDGYVERQKFLQRADVRQYEIERDIRLSQTKILR
ncbi:craniofacial development protein 1-like [Diadema antillarum]|uniref:craniofacial development protein 1-like n=1 Tax=Diadema antillarum TaxID=105358 RepID=UPI003A8A1075